MTTCPEGEHADRLSFLVGTLDAHNLGRGISMPNSHPYPNPNPNQHPTKPPATPPQQASQRDREEDGAVKTGAAIKEEGALKEGTVANPVPHVPQHDPSTKAPGTPGQLDPGAEANGNSK